MAVARVLLNRSKVASAERTTREYLHNVSLASCLVDLGNALDPLLNGVECVDKIFANFADTERSGEVYWNKSNFTSFIDARLLGNKLTPILTSLLWQIFCFAAHFPFSTFTFSQGQLSDSKDSEINLEAFRRAFALLILRGFELFGAKKDGSQLSWKYVKTSYADNVPRLTRVIFGALSSLSQDPGNWFSVVPEDLQVWNIWDAITFSQPLTYDPYPYGPSIPEELFVDAVTRVLYSQTTASKDLEPLSKVSRTDLRILIQLILLIRPDGRRWRAGQFKGEKNQRSGDIQYAHLVSDVEETARASEFAAAIVTSQFCGDEDFILWEAFKAWYADCVSLTNAFAQNGRSLNADQAPFPFLFFQLWAGIFAPTPMNLPNPQTKPTLPTATANLLSLLSTAIFKTDSVIKSRFHDNELQLQLDLQSSILVADLTTNPTLSAIDLYETLTAKAYFHVLLIRGVDLEPLPPAAERERRLIAAFLSPPELEMWRRERERQLAYVWRSSVMQLSPALAVADGSGMAARVADGALELRAHGQETQRSAKVVLDFRMKVVDVEGLGLDAGARSLDSSIGAFPRAEGSMGQLAEEARPREASEVSSKVRMQLTDLKCYRLPGEAVNVTRWP